MCDAVLVRVRARVAWHPLQCAHSYADRSTDEYANCVTNKFTDDSADGN